MKGMGPVEKGVVKTAAKKLTNFLKEQTDNSIVLEQSAINQWLEANEVPFRLTILPDEKLVIGMANAEA